jgi:ribosome-associated protein
MLIVNEEIRISEEELQWSYVRSGGPGGQNVNKVASKAVLRWDVRSSPSLPDFVRSRFLEQQKGRITTEGQLVLSSQRFRDQERNRQDCLEKLLAMLQQATRTPKERRATRPSAGSKKRRLASKKHRSAVKEGRRKLND